MSHYIVKTQNIYIYIYILMTYFCTLNLKTNYGILYFIMFLTFLLLRFFLNFQVVENLSDEISN
jgi:hypothetical protein